MAARKGVINEIAERRGSFAAAFVVIFIASFAFLFSVGDTPNPIHPNVIGGPALPSATLGASKQTAPQNPEAPVRVVAKDIGLDAAVENPVSTDLNVLDGALLKGAVHYPTSAQLGVDGTVLLFGHSSYLPIVHNQVYKTFDGIQNLKEGQIIDVLSAGTDYKYTVVGVKVADATQDSIALNPQGRHAVLVTCDSFATKSTRYIVTADFIGAYSLASN